MGRSGTWSRKGALPSGLITAAWAEGHQAKPSQSLPSQAHAGVFASWVPVFLNRQPQLQNKDDSRPNYASWWLQILSPRSLFSYQARAAPLLKLLLFLIWSHVFPGAQLPEFSTLLGVK